MKMISIEPGCSDCGKKQARCTLITQVRRIRVERDRREREREGQAEREER